MKNTGKQRSLKSFPEFIEEQMKNMVNHQNLDVVTEKKQENLFNMTKQLRDFTYRKEQRGKIQARGLLAMYYLRGKEKGDYGEVM